MMPREFARRWSWQLPLLTQVAHRQSCWLKMSSTLMRRVSRARGELVWTTMPSTTELLQAVTIAVYPFYFNGTDAAGGNFVELLEVAQMGDDDSC